MNISELTIQSIKWRDDCLYLLDQRRLPNEEVYLKYSTVGDVATAIRDMVVRGAPAIGIAAAYGVVLSAQAHHKEADHYQAIAQDIKLLKESRPTAINLGWALARMTKRLDGTGVDLISELLMEAQAIHTEDITANRKIGEAGSRLLSQNSRVLTHCNAGALATGGYGTALGVIRSAWKNGNLKWVYADETRPWLQGSRLTAWELQHEGIPTTLICDGAAASLMQQDKIDWVIVGADRIAANGDVANKIGTYGLAVLARQHQVKFMVAAPASTIDLSIAAGDKIPIEYRSATELLHLGSTRIAMNDIETWNPVFDVTPANLIDYIITENTVIERPDSSRMRAAFG